jgi:LPXTG-site transpeptidase (sortase) family protein
MRTPAHTSARVRLPLTLILALGALGMLLAACGGDDEPSEVVVATPEPTVEATPTRTPTPTPTAITPRAEPTEEATETVSAVQSVTSLQTFIDEYGYPSDATYARLRIPVLGVDARVASRYVGGDGRMATPAGPAAVAWYDLSAWPGLGGSPGSGNAIFSGHVDYNETIRYAGVHFRGRAVFYDLRRLSPGDLIEVDYNGQTLRYAVSWTRQVHATQGDWASVWRDNGNDVITLYTCDGEFDYSTRQYSDRLVVRAERVN